MLVRWDLLHMFCNLCGCKLLTLQVFCWFHVVIGVPYFVYVSFYRVGGCSGFFGHLYFILRCLKSGLGILDLGVIGGVFCCFLGLLRVWLYVGPIISREPVPGVYLT